MNDDMPPRALIVDDEAPAREELRYLLEQLGHVQVVGEATNGEEALMLLDSLAYDLVFLDVRMPGGTGLDVAGVLRERSSRPYVIFTTAYPDYAVEAFDLAAADYLVKPFDADRLERAVQRALGMAGDRGDDPSAGHPIRRPHNGDVEPLVRIPVQRDGRTVLVEGDAIIYAAANRGYSSLKLADERLLVSLSLSELERRLRGHFFRAHRSYLVNLDHVRELVPDYRGALVLVMDDNSGSKVEVSRRHAPELRRRLGL